MTTTAAMILPMIGLIFFTFAVMLWMLKLRYRAVLKDGLDPKYFRLYKNSELPDYLLKVTQHYQNLLEMPPLFYLAILLLVALNVSDVLYVVLSWGYLFARLAHSYVHTTSNRILQRRNTFISSMIILMVLWFRIALEVIGL